MDEMKTMYENRIKELEEKNMEVNSQYKNFLEKCGIKTVKEEDLLSLVNRALQFEYELIDQFIEDNYVLNTKAKKSMPSLSLQMKIQKNKNTTMKREKHLKTSS
jgi:hypothetical protein